MKKRDTCLLGLMMALFMTVCCITGCAGAQPNDPEEPGTEGTAVESISEEEVFSDWNPDAPALEKLVDYVESVTDESSDDFIPAADRIAVFDMDGTLFGEMFPTYLEYYLVTWRILKDPSFKPDEELLALGRELRDSVITGYYADDLTERYEAGAARAFSGMTLSEFSDYITERLLQNVDGFEGMTYGEAFYLPMIQVVEYLQEHGFTVYVCSGTDRFICRTVLEGALDIPYANIIGLDVAVEATGQNGADGMYYIFQPEDDIIRTDRLITTNVRMNKVSQIVRDIGAQPVLAFGNSSGDISMLNYTIHNNPYKSVAFMLIADDEERDYGYTRRARQMGETWEEYGYHVISIRDDFRTVYGDEVVRTGRFRWAEELADNR